MQVSVALSMTDALLSLRYRFHIWSQAHRFGGIAALKTPCYPAYCDVEESGANCFGSGDGVVHRGGLYPR